jgi:erythronate-4-phosphate dehydrogenase
MKEGGFFINSSRGQVCDENSLKKFMIKGYLAGCVLDVWETEPKPDPVLLKSADLATPHIAGYSLDGKLNATIASVSAFCNFFNIDIKLPDTGILPQPENSIIDIAKSHKNEFNALCDIVSITYPISGDSEILKQTPEKFEDMRGGYWPRREFGAYTLTGEHPIKNTLIQMGFKE